MPTTNDEGTAARGGGEVPAAAPPVDAPRGLGERILMMLLFAMVFSVLCWVLAVTALFQLALRLLGRPVSAPAQRFGAGLARYAAQIVAFVTFASEREPFPFSDWPQAPTGVTREDLADL
jgi:hypothetical protein